MPDLKNLTPIVQTSVQVKLDGFIEACILTCRAFNIGLTEALDLTIRALLREFAAHKFNPDLAEELWTAAASELLQARTEADLPKLN